MNQEDGREGASPRLNEEMKGIVAGVVTAAYEKVEPCDYIKLPESDDECKQREEARRVGEEAIEQGRVCLLTVAGGQGTRLGFDGPKGMYQVTPVKKKTLFQVFAEKLKHAESTYGVKIPWVLMTSEENDPETRQYFKENGNFGVEKLFFIKQGQIPVLGEDGRMLQDKQGQVIRSPDGHGGVYTALEKGGLNDELERMGVDVISYIQVDNPLVTCIDPVFIGYHILGGAEFSSKVVKKRDPEERVGVFCQTEEGIRVIEYSDLPEDLRGELNLGNLAVHMISREFCQNMAQGSFPYHKAEKVVTVDSVQVKCQKFEKFVFDGLLYARKTVVMEVDRAEEFSPVKNASGGDSPQTCIEAQVNLYKKWLKRVGVDVGAGVVEISALYATSEDEFVRKFEKVDFLDNLYIE